MAEPYNHYGTLLTDLKRYEDAIQLFEQSIQIDPNNPDPMVNLAWVKQTLGAETQAEKLYMKGNFWHLKSNLNRKVCNLDKYHLYCNFLYCQSTRI